MRPAASDDAGADSLGRSGERSAAREAEARSALVSLGVAWSLAGVSAAHHAGHILHLLVRGGKHVCVCARVCARVLAMKVPVVGTVPKWSTLYLYLYVCRLRLV